MKEKIYEIEIEEALQRVVKVKAFNLSEAIDKVKDKYDNEEIVLDASDYIDTKFNEYNDNSIIKKQHSYAER